MEALRIRRAIETVSCDLWQSFTADPSVRRPRVDRQLILAAARAEPRHQQPALAAARRVAEVYSETSDVLHGRTRGAAFSSSRVQDWHRDLARLQGFLSPPRT